MRCVVLHRAGEDVSGSQIGRDFSRSGLRPAIPPDRRSGDHSESGGRHPSELRDHLLGESPAEIRLGGVSVQVIERQNGDERRVARRAQDEPAGNQQRQQTGEQGNEARDVRCGVSLRRRRRLRRGARFGRNRTFFDAHVREKPISTSDHRLNKTRLVGAVPQCQPHLADGRVEALVQILESRRCPKGRP